MFDPNINDAIHAQNEIRFQQMEYLFQSVSQFTPQVSEFHDIGWGIPEDVMEYQMANHEYQQQGLSHYNQGYQRGPSELEETMNQFMQFSLAIQQNRKMQDVQLTKFFTEQNVRQVSTFQNSATCVETCNATSIKSAKALDEEVENDDVEKEEDNRAAEDEEDEIVVTEMNKEVKKRDQSKKKKACDKMASKVIPSQHLPYPHAPSKKD